MATKAPARAPLALTARLLKDGRWWVAFCSEVPEANGQGRTRREALESLRQAVELLFEDRRDDARRELEKGAELVPMPMA